MNPLTRTREAVPQPAALPPPEGATLLPAARARALPQGGWMQREQTVMGNAVLVQLWADDRSRGAAAMAAVMAEMQRIERHWSPHRAESELARVNACAVDRPVPIGDALFQLLARAQEISRLAGGAFDVTCGSAGLPILRGGDAADELSLARAAQSAGWRQLQLDALTPSVRFARAGLRIDLGGIALGWAVERCAALLARQGIRHALVSAGGDTRLLGDRRGRPWTVAVRDPRSADAVLALLPLQDVAVSTSSDAGPGQTGCRSGGASLLDPRTGRAPGRVRSATVIAPDGVAADALSTAVFVLGVERGLRLVHEHGGADAVIVDAEGRLHASAGFDALAVAGPPQLERA